MACPHSAVSQSVTNPECPVSANVARRRSLSEAASMVAMALRTPSSPAHTNPLWSGSNLMLQKCACNKRNEIDGRRQRTHCRCHNMPSFSAVYMLKCRGGRHNKHFCPQTDPVLPCSKPVLGIRFIAAHTTVSAVNKTYFEMSQTS